MMVNIIRMMKSQRFPLVPLRAFFNPRPAILMTLKILDKKISYLQVDYHHGEQGVLHDHDILGAEMIVGG